MVFHGRIEDLLDIGGQAVDLVDEQHIVGFEVGEDRGEIARLGQNRSGRRAKIDPQFPRDDLRQGCLAQTWRPEE